MSLTNKIKSMFKKQPQKAVTITVSSDKPPKNQIEEDILEWNKTIYGALEDSLNEYVHIQTEGTPEEKAEYKRKVEKSATEFEKKQEEWEKLEEKWENEYQINKKAYKLQKEGRINEAIRLYEQNVTTLTDLPCTYEELYHIYKQRKDYDNAIRVCDIAIQAIGNKKQRANAEYFQKLKNKAYDDTDEDVLNNIENYDSYEIFYATYRIFKEQEKQKNIEELNKLTPILNQLKTSEISDWAKARVYRMIGEIGLLQDKKEVALNNFEKALSLDPNVGVKRKYNKLMEAKY